MVQENGQSKKHPKIAGASRRIYQADRLAFLGVGGDAPSCPYGAIHPRHPEIPDGQPIEPYQYVSATPL